ncbi:hypothetical protein [Planktotalea sp.]|uniref:hypothetical protein n=1 Tax=Planktotalea sp. TaxID=2029877 RepID=UPI003F6C1E81
MTEQIFRAADSDSAMEKAIRELGEDAMILSVKRKGDVTEVRAIKESLVSLPKVTPAPFSKGVRARTVSLSDALRSAETRRQEPSAEPSMPARPSLDYFFGGDPFVDPSPAPEKKIQKQPLPLDEQDEALFGKSTKINEIFSAQKPDINEAPRSDEITAPNDEDPTPETPASLYPLMDKAAFEDSDTDPLLTESAQKFFETFRAETADTLSEASPLSSHIPQQDPAIEPTQEDISKTVSEITPDPMPEPARNVDIEIEPVVKHSAPSSPDVSQILRQNGFSSHLVHRCSNHADLVDLESCLTFACQELAAQLSVSKEKPTPLDSDILFVFGPSGSGKTTTVAKLAFARNRDAGIKPSLHAIGPKCFVSDAKLSQFSQLLDTDFIDTVEPDHIEAGQQVIIDCCHKDDSEIIKSYEQLKRDFPQARVQPVMTLPGTWSNLATEQYCSDIAQLQPCTILTHLQIGALGIAGFSTLAAHKLSLLAASESDLVADGIDIIDTFAIAHFLRETFSYTGNQAYPI